jgi:micrococcal nuclease
MRMGAVGTVRQPVQAGLKTRLYNALPPRALCFLFLLSCSPESDAFAQRVRQVIDGDTITVSGVGVVRLLGVDAPEKTGGYRDAERFGDEAAAFMRKLVDGRMVRLEHDGERKDQYNRTLAYVFLPDGTLANEAIIRAGLAEVYRRFEFRLKGRMLAAEREARDAHRGLWASR